MTATAIRWRTCEDCRADFTAPRRGRPPKYCPDCAPARRKSRRGAVRLAAGASSGEGVYVRLRPSSGRPGAVLSDEAREAEAMFHDAFGGNPAEGVPGAFLTTDWLDYRRRRHGSDKATQTFGLDPADDRRGPYGTPDRTVPEIVRVIGSLEPWGWVEEWQSRGFCPWVARNSVVREGHRQRCSPNCKKR